LQLRANPIVLHKDFGSFSLARPPAFLEGAVLGFKARRNPNAAQSEQ
jgi:hypothetical protein